MTISSDSSKVIPPAATDFCTTVIHRASWSLWRAASAPEGDIRQGPRVPHRIFVLRAAAQGLGMALARDRLAAEDVATGSLVRVFGALQLPLPDAYWILRAETARARIAVTTVITGSGQPAAVAGAPATAIRSAMEFQDRRLEQGAGLTCPWTCRCVGSAAAG